MAYAYAYRFQKFERHVFYSSPFAVCLESLVEIRSAVLDKSGVKDERRAQVRAWVQTRQRFSGVAWPIFVQFSLSGAEFIRPESDGVAFFENSLACSPCLMKCGSVHPKSDIFAPQPDTSTEYRFHSFLL